MVFFLMRRMGLTPTFWTVKIFSAEKIPPVLTKNSGIFLITVCQVRIHLIRIQGFDGQNWKKINSWTKKNFSSNCILPILGSLYRTSKPQKKPSALKKEYPALQNMTFQNFFYFCGSFLPTCIRIRIPNPDPDWIRIRNAALLTASGGLCTQSWAEEEVQLGPGAGRQEDQEWKHRQSGKDFVGQELMEGGGGGGGGELWCLYRVRTIN